MRKGKPTVDDITTVIPKCVEHYSGLFNKFEEDERHYELNFKNDLRIPEEFKTVGVVLPTARDVVDVFVNNINLANARVFVNKKGKFEVPEEEADMLQKFYYGVIHSTNVESDISPWRVGPKHYALHGLAVYKTVWDADRWPDKPLQKDDESEKEYAERIDTWRAETHLSVPIHVQAVNPSCILPDPSYGGRQFVIERQKRIVFDVMQRWPRWKNDNGLSTDQEVDYDSYWDATYRCDLIDGQPILKGGVVKHNYGFLPYVLINSGLGNESREGKPEMRYVGILRYIYEMLASESRNYSIFDIILGQTSWGGGFLQGDDANAVTSISQKFGEWNRLPAGVKAIPIIPQTPPTALADHLYRTSEYISSYAAPRSVRGLSETGVRSGTDRRLMIAQGTTRYQYAEKAFASGTAKVLINCAKLMKNVIPGTMRVWARTPTDEFDVEIDKKKMHEPFTCSVEFSPVSDEDEYTRHDDLIRLTNSKIATKEWARKQMHNIDAKSMEKDEIKEQLKENPMVQQVLGQYFSGKLMQALQTRGAADALTGDAITLGENPQANLGGHIVPPSPNIATPGSAQDMQNQLQNLRSPNAQYPNQGQGGGGKRW